MSKLIKSADTIVKSPVATNQFLASFSDTDLLDGWIKDCEKEAFAQLVHRYSVMVLSVCRRGCHSHADADDAYQSTFLYLAMNASKIRHREQLAGWLHRVAQRAAVAICSTKKHETNRMIEPADKHDDPLCQITQRHEAMVVDEELATLPEHYRVALVLHILEGQSLGRMADQLGTTIGAVRGQLQRGKQLLAQRLRRRGLVPVLAIAASMASTVSQAQAQSAGKTFLQTMDGSSIPEPPIDTSLLKSFLYEGVRVMKAPYLTCLVATATILIALAAMTDSGIGGDNHQPATIDDVVQFPAILAHVRQMPSPQFVAVQANDENGKVQSGQTDESGKSTDSTKLIWTDKTVVPKPTSAIARKAEEVLDQVVPIVENNMPLSEWAETLSASINVPVELSSRALALAKLDPNSTSILMKNESLPLRLVFRKALQPLGLKVVVQDEGLVITADLLAQVRSGNNASRWINVDEEPEKIVAEALDRPTDIDVTEMPLHEVLAMLADQHKIPIEIDRLSLNEAGVKPDVPVTLSKRNAKLRSVLSQIFYQIVPHDVTYTVQDEALRVISMEMAEAFPLVRIYWLEGTGYPASNLVELINLIQTNIHPDGWADTIGGPGTISPVGSGIRPGIVVSTTYPTHFMIENLLARLRDSYFGPDPVTEKAQVPLSENLNGRKGLWGVAEGSARQER